MAAAAVPSSTGLLNLEKELVCFICTEILYQPLTLLDCLHTFCGSCLKEWFSHQHRKALHSHSSSSAAAYTCPTCRAVVKDVQHNAMINTLLEMFLAANPEKDRSQEEKAEMAQAYKPGDDILPKIDGHRRRERRRREEENVSHDRRGQDDRSRREQQLHPSSADTRRGPRSSSGSTTTRERRPRSDSSRNSDRTGRHQRQSSVDAVGSRARSGDNTSTEDVPSSSPALGSPRHPDAVEARQRGARTVAHQASLISIVSASESGTGTGESLNEAQVMQEILAAGLLDGINIDDLTEAEQDELSEMIAERYRQLHPERLRRAPSNGVASNGQGPTSGRSEEQREEVGRRPRAVSSSSQRQQTHPSPRTSRSVVISSPAIRPPTSFPQSTTDPVLPTFQDRAHRRRASNESGRSEQSATRTGRRSATDLAERPQSSSTALERPRQLANTNRANTEPRTHPRASEMWQATGRQVASPPQTGSPASQSPRIVMSSVNTGPVPTTIPSSEPSIPAIPATATSTGHTEPSVTCARCSRRRIQYEVHKHCSSCNLDLCMSCYRIGRGCNHWFGFGHAAMFKFDSSHPARPGQAIELPHLLIGRQYQRPSVFQELSLRNSTQTSLDTSSPNSRLLEGNFCDRCGAFANECFWSCDYCNDGEWGFCNDCVNTNHCCSHPLLPVAHKSTVPNVAPRLNPSTQPGAPTLSPFSAVGGAPSPAHSAPSSATSTTGFGADVRLDFVPLVITTNCDICLRPIPPDDLRYHCPEHVTPSPENSDQKGDYDLCQSCYLSFVKSGRIKHEDGPDGWRLCPEGHRMIAVVFEMDADGGQRRIIRSDVVGGTKMTGADMAAWKLARANLHETPSADLAVNSSTTRGKWTWREDTTSTRRATRARTARLSAPADFPPNGGIGKICRALWSYYPEEGEEGKGELMFPRHAEVSEIEEVNEDWWFGVYAGDMGYCPAAYLRDIASG
ncbi:hypothetical protein PV08_05777 [Exophiala spinifera]|uniref:RING-type domain-containing protein n=1 Tax=Exophiala spinifera TaxID=91928 RepID=A0A0D1ZSC6_9EURO|nr:uncharacterized protein PV08_05777 [Exophiala spinifera]KIW15727.1 hypothetical protein PV08_05777 [Exophiala spinifera]